MSVISKLLRRFIRREDGNVVVEAVLVIPMLAWAQAGIYSYWDQYRTITTVQKASYSISDLVSRQQGTVNDAFIAGLKTTMEYLLDTDQTVKMRMTSYTWSDADSRYEVVWSVSPGNQMTTWNTGTIANIKQFLPDMSDGDSAVLLETAVQYTPAIDFGLAPNTIKQFIVTRPRFLPQICHDSFACS